MTIPRENIFQNVEEISLILKIFLLYEKFQKIKINQRNSVNLRKILNNSKMMIPRENIFQNFKEISSSFLIFVLYEKFQKMSINQRI